MLSEIRLRYQIPTLKKAVVDVCLAIYSRQPHADDRAMVLDFTSKEEPEVQLHFLAHAVARKSSSLIGMIAGQLVPIINRLAASELWRTRLGIVELLTDLVALAGNAMFKGEFSDLCQRLITDESWDVREAAVRQLINLDDMRFIDGKLPITILELGKSGTFRKRQAALLLMKHLSQKGIGASEKLLLKAELGKYASASECPNIVSLATAILTEFPE
jgi:HEAT repeat protein